MSDFVLDASVSTSLLIPATEAQRHYAKRIFDLIANGAIPAVPSLWMAETASVLIKARRSKLITKAAYEIALETLDSMSYIPHHVAYTVREIVDIAEKAQLTGYDAVYLDLARKLKIPMATVDAGIVSACQRYRIAVL